MWIGQGGAGNVESLRDDPWALFMPSLENRVKGLTQSELEALDADLFSMQMEVMLEASAHFVGSSREVELQFEGKPIGNTPIFEDNPVQADTASVLLSEVARVELRWRPDAIFAAEVAVSGLLAG